MEYVVSSTGDINVMELTPLAQIETSNSLDTQEDQSALLAKHLPLVWGIVKEVARRLPHWIDRDSLAQSGVVGLLEAAQRYDPGYAIPFANFAAYRIKGEIFEYLRSLDIASRGVRAWGRTLTATRRQLLNRYGREASSEEMAEALDLPLSRYHQIAHRVDVASLLPLEETVLTDDADALSLAEVLASPFLQDPAVEVEQKDFARKLALAVDALPTQERCVMTLYYQEDLTLKEIGILLNLTEGRISQVHKKAVFHLREALELDVLQ